MTEEIKKFIEPGVKNIIMIYILYILGNFTAVLPLVGAIFAFVYIGHENNMLRTHYQFAFRTFVLGVVAIISSFIISAILLFINPVMAFISILLYIMIFAWFVLRCIFAIRCIVENKPHPNPLTLSIN